MKLPIVLILLSCLLPAQELQKIENACSAEDADALGLACSEEDPCPVFLELVSSRAAGDSLFVAGNLHTADTTLSSLLLMSQDGGKTWSEPAKRVRSATLEQIQFADAHNGWVAGMILDPFPKDPFLLVTNDGGKTWRQAPIFEESRSGYIQQFWFDSPKSGELIVDRSQGNEKSYERYRSMTGGDSWELQGVEQQPVRLGTSESTENQGWRVRADASAYHMERHEADGWEKIASFAIHAGNCK